MLFLFLRKIMIIKSFYFLILLKHANCFNFDLNKTIIHKPPYLKSSSFGYSVAGYKVDNDSWFVFFLRNFL
jgi:hypothetical protein